MPAHNPRPTTHNLVLPLPDGATPPSRPVPEPDREPTVRLGRRQLTARQHRGEALLYWLEFALQMTWIVVRLLAALVPLAVLVAWGVEVYWALRVGGPHVKFALAGLAVLVLFGMVATAVERFKNYRAASHVHLHHHRGRW
ncbi:hypothetical protein [Deinococcus sp. S9]|uniref:hypothetical protein n=1 Tax=Deinococcus sp. S9 TaxID=2545754 RepID=UPI001055590A|nr:hypothetical protein [Deinococcus sp. S9]TDE84978.1 hypothetical protein E0686_14140 [Deinococcus sp. S9]